MKSTRASVFDIKVKKCTVYKTKIILCFFACDAYKSEGFSVYTLRTPCLAKIKFPDVGKHIANFTKLAQLQKKVVKVCVPWKQIQAVFCGPPWEAIQALQDLIRWPTSSYPGDCFFLNAVYSFIVICCHIKQSYYIKYCFRFV